MSGATNADSDLPTPPPVTRVDNLAPPVHTMQGSSAAPTTMREKRNWLIHLLYVRQDFHDCIAIIEEQLSECKGLCEYAIYVKALIKRANGELQESLTLFQAATVLNPHNVANLKQVGRALYLLGKHKAASDIYEEAKSYSEEDWEICHNMGLCYLYLKNYDRAEECFIKANVIQRHDSTYMQLGKLYTLQEKYQEAIDIYLEALDYSPENPELLTTVGLLYLRLGENFKAFDYLGNSLTHDPKNPKTILAAGSIIQDHSDMDVALTKYRIAAVQTPNSAQLWNNIGMCFFGKQNHIAAVSCLKRALYLAPFEWIIAYNLGLVYLNTGQYASAFHYFSASINLKPDFASTYMYLAITLSRLDDFENACSAYEKAISMESDHLFELNYAITLYNNEQLEDAKQHFAEFEKLFQELDEEARISDPDILEIRQQVSSLLGDKQ
jgi:Bardet-Biedl syndrome 4 protein